MIEFIIDEEYESVRIDRFLRKKGCYYANKK